MSPDIPAVSPNPVCPPPAETPSALPATAADLLSRVVGASDLDQQPLAPAT